MFGEPMVKQVIMLLLLSILLAAIGTSMLVSTGDAAQPGDPMEGGRESGGEDTHVYADPAHKMRWLTRDIAKPPDPSPLNVGAFVICVVLVALLGVGVLIHERRAPPI
jgi:hypothetical protein